MDPVALVTLLTAIFSVAVKVIGMPDQIKSNYRRKSTGGLSPWFMISTFVSYDLWVVHGLQVHDMALVIGQGLGALVMAIILSQMFMYRSNRDKAPDGVRPPLFWYSVSLMKARLAMLRNQSKATSEIETKT